MENNTTDALEALAALRSALDALETELKAGKLTNHTQDEVEEASSRLHQTLND